MMGQADRILYNSMAQNELVEDGLKNMRMLNWQRIKELNDHED